MISSSSVLVPAGARFARRAAEKGYDVLALEKGTVGEPLACSGHVSTDIWEFVPEEARERLFENRIYGANFLYRWPRTPMVISFIRPTRSRT